MSVSAMRRFPALFRQYRQHSVISVPLHVAANVLRGTETYVTFETELNATPTQETVQRVLEQLRAIRSEKGGDRQRWIQASQLVKSVLANVTYPRLDPLLQGSGTQ